MKKLFTFLFILLYSTTFLSAQNKTYVPDDNFEQELINLGYDSGALDDSVLTSNINSVVSLDLSNKGISDLSGIEGFALLDTLIVFNNGLTTLDLTSNATLQTLDCSNNIITSLDLSGNPLLDEVNCELNQLQNIDLSGNFQLERLYINDNSLSNIDLLINDKLVILEINNNNLNNLNLSNNDYLLELYCQNNNLTSLDLRNGFNGNLFFLATLNNPNLYCIDVDDTTHFYSLINISHQGFLLDPQNEFSTDCNNAFGCMDPAASKII